MTLPHNHTDTSKAAARNPHVISKSGHDRRVICQFIASRGSQGATDGEIYQWCPEVHFNAARARRGECEAHGVVTAKLGERRRGETGLAARVYHITATGLRALGLDENQHWCAQ
jgi:hypothetical protein